jgi:NADP-dependent 3-hydroxy acid dehydrogenase YdfG
MTTPPLRDRIALVTGASAGIGHAVACELATMGARVGVNARREELLEALTQEIADRCAPVFGPVNGPNGLRALAIPGDAADEGVIGRMLDDPERQFGSPVDLVVVNAGRGLAGSALTSDPEQWEEVIRINLTGAARLIRAAGERLAALQEKRGWAKHPADIVVLGSTVGRHISPFSSMYGSTKAAVGSLAEAARRELGPKGVRVTLIEPGIVRSEFQGVAGYDAESFGALMDKFGPVLTPGDVARTIGFIVRQPAGVHLCDVVIRPTRQDYP